MGITLLLNLIGHNNNCSASKPVISVLLLRYCERCIEVLTFKPQVYISGDFPQYTQLKQWMRIHYLNLTIHGCLFFKIGSNIFAAMVDQTLTLMFCYSFQQLTDPAF
jgi:hypothetical protein